MNFVILINGAEGGKITVPAIPAEAVGIYNADLAEFFRPDCEQIGRALPYRLRRSFERTSGRFWFDKAAHIDGGRLTGGYPPYLELRGYRGRYLATLYAIPDSEVSQT